MVRLLSLLVLCGCASLCPPQAEEIVCQQDGHVVYQGGIHNEELAYYVVLIGQHQTMRLPKGQCQKFNQGGMR